MKTDEQLQADIIAELKSDSRIRAGEIGRDRTRRRLLNWSGAFRNTDIQPEVRHGHVTLNGGRRSLVPEVVDDLAVGG